MSITMPRRATSPSSSRRMKVVRWITGGALLAGAIVAIAIAVWPASEADKAYADGEQLGQAVGRLYDAQSAEEVDAALQDVDAAVADAADHAGDAVSRQVNDQADALARAADGVAGTHTSDDAFSVDVYQAELNEAIDDLASQADDFRNEGPEVRQAYWDGVQAGMPDTAA
jgi:hypothetical protein